MDTSTIWLIISPWALYVGYSEVNLWRRRKQDEADKHRRELKAEADSKLQNAYGPLLYRLEVAMNEPARQSCREGAFKWVLAFREIDVIGNILASSRHLIAEDILWYWDKRFAKARFTQWNANEGTEGPNEPETGYACDLDNMWQRTKSDYDLLMKQYQDNRY